MESPHLIDCVRFHIGLDLAIVEVDTTFVCEMGEIRGQVNGNSRRRTLAIRLTLQARLERGDNVSIRRRMPRARSVIATARAAEAGQERTLLRLVSGS